ncbi:MAG: ABC transporter permease [Longimicrobiaceae bacterium]
MATPVPDETPVWSRAWALHVLDRIGHVWFENPLTLVTFMGRLLAASGVGFAALASRRAGAVLARLGRQLSGTFFRGVAVVIALGMAGGLVIGTFSRLGGSVVQPLLEDLVLPVVVRDLAPLGLAVALAGRMGASITTKLAVLPARLGRPAMDFRDRELNRHVVPQLVAGLVTAPLLFLVLAWFLLAGYEGSGNLFDLLGASPTRFFWPPWKPLAVGALRAAAFGAVVAFVASALGVREAERFDDWAGEGIDLNRAVWEASVTSILICAAFTLIFLTRTGMR